MTKRTRLGLLFLTFALILAILVIVLQKKPAGRSSVDRVELLRDKNAALGLMENGDYEQAIPLLERIVRETPADALGHRNLALALLAPNDAGQARLRGAEAGASLLASIERLLQVDESSSATHLLAARAYIALAEQSRAKPAELRTSVEQARQHYQRAAALAPRDPAPHYGLYLLETDFEDPERLSASGLEALRAAAERAPNNLAAQLELVTRLAEAGHTDTRGKLEFVLNLAPRPEPSSPPDPQRDALAELQAAARELQPGQVSPSVAARIRAARNLSQRHPDYQQGLSELTPHPRALMLEDFGPEFYRDLPMEPQSTVAVRFEAVRPAGAVGENPRAIARDDLLSNGKPATVVLRADGDATRVEVLSGPGQAGWHPLELPGRLTECCLADLDFDVVPGPQGNVPADLDAVVYGPDGLHLLENRLHDSQRVWVDRTTESGIPRFRDVVWLLVCDVDHDGNLDLVVGLSAGIRVLRNRGMWAFEDITERSAGLQELAATAAVFGDFDRDGDLDLMVLARDGKLVELTNRRIGRFSTRPLDTSLKDARCLLAFDANNDGRLDLLVSGASGSELLLANPDGPSFEAPRRMAVPATTQVRQAGILDWDNDGWLDVWLLTDHAQSPLRLWRNLAGSSLEDASDRLPALSGPVPSLAIDDLDDDGDLDFLVLSPKELLELRNNGGNQNHWLRLRLRALLLRDTGAFGPAAKCNYHGIGCTAEIRAGRHYQLQQVQGTVTHFGLGPRRRVELGRVVWTNGVPQAIIRPAIDQTLAEEQRPKGSCPFLYAWDGQRFVFVTDCLWASALGMRLPDGRLMDHQRQENHLLIREQQLRPRDGEYCLQFTNELWEVPYLDQAELWVIDHPAEVEMYTNQRVPPNSAEPFQLLPVRRRRPPLAARDQQQRDVLDIIRERDGRYVGGFQRRRYVGLAEPHWLELDLGDLSQARQVTLFLTGWIWPTDTSGNTAIARSPHLQGKGAVIGGCAPPQLLVPDGRGNWTPALASMGFPAGKLQTVAVALKPEWFPAGDYRVRIATEMELYWDEAFLSVDEPAAETIVRRLAVGAAELRYRGYSLPTQQSPFAPHLFSYEDVDRSPIWLPIPGPCTRYGDVTELLREPDSRYVVMSPGDEVTLRFAALPPPDRGRARTFLFYANGWLKDFDMNGEAGDEVGPFPFEGMTRYPYEARDDSHDPRHLEFRKAYLTREGQSAAFWNHLSPTR